MVSAWWPICTAGPTTTSSTAASPSWSAWPTAAPRGPRSIPGDGAGILVQIPHRFLAGAAGRPGSRCPTPAATRSGLAFLPTDADDAAKARTVVEHTAAEEGLTVLGLARRADRRRRPRPDRQGRHAPHRAALRRAGRSPASTPWRSSGAAFVLRKRVEHAVDGVYFPSLSARTIVYKGMLTSEQLRQFFPDLRDPDLRVGPGAGALALLDQHLPQLAAGPPVPLPLPQRRDQHAGRQPQLDAGPRGAARDARSSTATCRASTRSAPRGRATRPASTRCSSCCTSAGARCPTPC